VGAGDRFGFIEADSTRSFRQFFQANLSELDAAIESA
jgi:hypothetical protein